MRLSLASLLCWWFALAIPSFAEESWSISFSNIEPVVRTNTVWRATVTGQIPPAQFEAGPYHMQVSLTQANTIIASQDIQLTKLGQLVPGVYLNMVITPSKHREAPVTVLVTVNDTQLRDTRSLQQQLVTPLGIQRGIEAHRLRALERGKLFAPLPALWFEQAGELIDQQQASLQTCEALLSLEQSIAKWLNNGSIDSSLQAIRDPLDDSVQPWRIHLPISGAARAVVLMLRSDNTVMRKSAWPVIPPSWINMARSNHLAVIEVYAAGDRDWTGVATTRAQFVLAHALQTHPNLQSLPLVVFGVDRGAQGALALVEKTPQQFSALALYRPIIPLNNAPSLTPLSQWQSLQRPGMRPAHIIGTPIIHSGVEDPGAISWVERMRLTQTPISEDVGSPQHAHFWQLCAAVQMVPAPSEYHVIGPGAYGRVTVEEMAQWGTAGTLHWRSPNELMTTGIAVLRLNKASDILVNGAPYVDVPAKNNPSNATRRKIFGKACGPAASYAERAFTVVIGTGESAAAVSQNRTLANDFTAAWVAHAHGRPRTVDDSHFIEEEHRDRHLVIIGNTRSNSILAKLIKDDLAFPAEWTTREFTIDNKTWLRSEHRPVVITWPHPANDGRVLVVLDGSARWLQPGLPLASLPDLAVGGQTTNDEPELWRYFSTDWR